MLQNAYASARRKAGALVPSGTRGELTASRGVDLAITILLVVVVAAAVLPAAFSDWFDATATGGDLADAPTMITTLWDLVPLFAILAIVLYFYQKVDM